MYQTVRYEKKDRIGIATINRPEALNALNSQVIADLEALISEVEKDTELRAFILTGEGRSFVAGADIGEQKPMDVAQGRKWGQRGSALFRRIEKLEIPTIAAVNGFALGGGCEMALACDIRIASEKAKFGQPEVGLGIIPGFGGTQRMARIIGTGAAMELIAYQLKTALSGVSAQEVSSPSNPPMQGVNWTYRRSSFSIARHTCLGCRAAAFVKVLRILCSTW